MINLPLLSVTPIQNFKLSISLLICQVCSILIILPPSYLFHHLAHHRNWFPWSWSTPFKKTYYYSRLFQVMMATHHNSFDRKWEFILKSVLQTMFNRLVAPISLSFADDDNYIQNKTIHILGMLNTLEEDIQTHCSPFVVAWTMFLNILSKWTIFPLPKTADTKEGGMSCAAHEIIAIHFMPKSQKLNKLPNHIYRVSGQNSTAEWS